MRAIGFSRQKAGYARDLAGALNDGFDLGTLSVLTDDEVRFALTQHRGIGRWTADIYLVTWRPLRPDIWPRGDLALRTAAAELTGEGRPSDIELADGAQMDGGRIAPSPPGSCGTTTCRAAASPSTSERACSAYLGVVDHAVSLGVLRSEDEVAIQVLVDLLDGLALVRAPRISSIMRRCRTISSAWIRMSSDCPCIPPCGWCSSTRACARA